jgi:hypothetical protein
MHNIIQSRNNVLRHWQYTAKYSPHSDWWTVHQTWRLVYVDIKKNQQSMNVQSYMSFDGIFRNNNCINFYDIYYRLKRLRITSKGWKSLQWLHSSRLRCYIIHMIGVHKSILMFLSLKLYIYCLILKEETSL